MSQIPVSNTEISTFKGCRRRWWLTYYRNRRAINKDYTGALPLGSRVHKTLERLYTNGEDPVSVYTELLSDDRTLASQSDLFDSKKFDNEGDLGLRMVEGYQEWAAEEGIDSGLEVLGVEETLAAPMADGAVLMVGKIDLRVMNKRYDMQAVLDFKTSRDFSMFDKTGAMQPQLKQYQLLWRLTRSEGEDARLIDGGIYRLLRKVKRTAAAKPPFYRDVVIRHSNQTLRAFWNELHGTLYDMLAVRRTLDESPGMASVVAYPRVSSECTWICPFFTICPMFDDTPDAAEQALEELTEEVNPYDYYGSDVVDLYESRNNHDD